LYNLNMIRQSLSKLRSTGEHGLGEVRYSK
jgi:hypothetical protein